MAKRRVRTGSDLESIGQLGISDPEIPNALEDARGSGVSEGVDADNNIVQHYYDIGKLIGAGTPIEEIPEGPLDNEIKDELNSVESAPQEEGLSELDSGGEGLEGAANLAEYAQGLGGIDKGLEGEQLPSEEQKLATEAPMGLPVEEEIIAPREKGEGFFGRIDNGKGGYSTEISIGVNIDGQEIEIPTLVPTLSNAEIKHLVDGGEPTPEIVEEAIKHARVRMLNGKSPFAELGEQEGQEGLLVGQQAGQEGLLVGGQEGEAGTLQPVYGAVKEGLQNPDVRTILLENGVVLEGATEKQLEAWEAMITNNAAEDADMAKRIENLREKVETKSLTKTDMILLGAAVLMPTLIAAAIGGPEAMLEAAGKAMEGGLGAFKKQDEQKVVYSKELTALQKQQAEQQAKRGKITEDFTKTISDYGVKQALNGKDTYIDDNGMIGVGFGAKNIFFEVDAIPDVATIEAMRKDQPKIQKAVETYYNSDRVLNEIRDTSNAIKRSGALRNLPNKTLARISPDMWGPKAIVDGKEVNLIQQLRSQLARLGTVVPVTGDTRFSKTMINTVEQMLKDPTQHILDSSIDDLLNQVESTRASYLNDLGTYLNSNSVVLEPVLQGYRTVTPESEYQLPDKQNISGLDNVSVEKAKSLLTYRYR